jgi:hypothetical protein
MNEEITNTCGGGYLRLLMDQDLLTLPEHLSSYPVFSGVSVTRSLVLCVCFVDRCLSFCLFFFWPLCCLSFDLWKKLRGGDLSFSINNKKNSKIVKYHIMNIRTVGC